MSLQKMNWLVYWGEKKTNNSSLYLFENLMLTICSTFNIKALDFDKKKIVEYRRGLAGLKSEK